MRQDFPKLIHSLFGILNFKCVYVYSHTVAPINCL